MTVKPDRFVQSMRNRWSQQYGLKSSKALEQAWHEMAVTFNEHIQGKVVDEWSVLRLPTGAGKTQGLALYCSLLSEQKDPPGVLVITKFTDEIDDLVKTINQSPYKETAIAEHGKLKVRPTLKELRAAPVLAITHSMYKQALDAAYQDNVVKSSWDKFTEWEYGSRKLIVIDEALDVVEPVYVSHDILRMVRGWIPRHIEISKSELVAELDKIISQFSEWERRNPNEHDGEVVTADLWSGVKLSEISALFDELDKLPLGQMMTGMADKGAMIKRCKKIYSDIAYVLSNQSWYKRKNGAGALNSAYVALPTHIDSAVIMDATAQQSCAYDLLAAIPNFRQIPDNVRNYRNVRLHVLYGYQNSKYHLMQPEQDEQHFLDVVDALVPSIPQNTKFLFVTFGDVEKKLSRVKAKYKKCKVTHWGDINGKNRWSDCTAMIIYGLQRLDPVDLQSFVLAFENWHKKTKRAFIPAPEIEVMDDGTYSIETYENIVTEEDYHKGYVASDVIQAINRVQCRKIMDDDGGCAETDVYILLNKKDDKFESAILDAIKMEMNGIQIITSDAPTVQKKKVHSRLGQEIIKKLSMMPVEVYPVITLVDEIMSETGIGSVASRKSFTKKCKDDASPEAKTLAAVGYRYVADVKGGKGNMGSFRPIKN